MVGLTTWPSVVRIFWARHRLFSLIIIIVAVALVAALAYFLPVVLSWLVATLLVIFFAVRWNDWVRGSSQVGGVPVLILAVGVMSYSLGSVRLADRAPYADQISESQWWLYFAALLVAAMCLLAGIAARAHAVRHDRRFTAPPRVPAYPLWILIVATVVGLAVCWTNFLTGTIPLLADSINEARKAGISGALRSLSFLAYPTLQFVVVAGVAVPFRGIRIWMRVAVIAVSLGSLVLTGSRSFLVFPLLALLCIWIAWRRPSLLRLGVIGLTGMLVVAAAGQLRAVSSGTGANLVNNAEQWGYGPPITSGVLSYLQVGPHVFAGVMERIPDAIPFQHGVFFLRDFPILSAGSEADYWITADVLGRDSFVNGGLPPTLLGGLYIDWGFAGALVGVGLVFVLLGLLRPAPTSLRRSGAVNVAFALTCAYVLTSYYSYISLKVGFITMLLWCVALSLSRWLEFSVLVLHRRERWAHDRG